MNWKKKLEYFWMYYKISFLIGLGILAAVSYFGYAKLTEKELAFQALLFDIHTNVSGEALEKDFASYAGIDTRQQEVTIIDNLLLEDGTSNYAMTSLSKFYALIGTEDLDVAMMLEKHFLNYVNADAFLDLRELFSEEELNAFPGVYQDETGKILGIYAEDFAKVKEIGGYEENEDALQEGEEKSSRHALVGVAYNSRHTGTAKAFLQYMNGR